MTFPSKESEFDGLPFELISNSNECDYSCDFYINRLGLRNPEIEIQKPQRVFRIVVLGDSHVFGGKIFANTIPQLIQQHLANDSELKELVKKDFEVINAGILTFNLKAIYHLYHYKIKQLEPDLVLYVFHTNDLEKTIYKPETDNRGRTYFIAYPSLKYIGDYLNIFPAGIEKFLITNSYFYRYLSYLSEVWSDGSKSSSYNSVQVRQLTYLDRLYKETKENKSK
ncbi:MAG: hypothetical protein N3B13_10540, partial [Deltaproteobacteria bacterium]|nr:hypothetical protein [Deltaproteobacteria bacterium]